MSDVIDIADYLRVMIPVFLLVLGIGGGLSFLWFWWTEKHGLNRRPNCLERPLERN